MDFGYNNDFRYGIIDYVNQSSSGGTQNYWWIGAIIYVIGSIMINFGSNIIKKDHLNTEKLELALRPPLYKRYLWIAGFTTFAVGNVFNFVAFMFAAQSLLAALGSIQFVSNLLFAFFINGEKITKSSIVATAFIIGGNIIIVIFGSKANRNNDLDELKALLLQKPFLIYLTAIFITVIVLQSIYLFFYFQMKKIQPPEQPPYYMTRYQPIAYAAVSAIIGTNSVIMGKACAGLLKNLIHGDYSVLTSIWTYAIVLGFIVVTSFWLYRLNSALKLYDAMFIIPILQCIWLIFGVIGGGIFYQEFREFTLMQGIFFISGMVLLVFGIVILRPSKKDGDVSPASLETEVVTESNPSINTSTGDVEIEMEEIIESK